MERKEKREILDEDGEIVIIEVWRVGSEVKEREWTEKKQVINYDIEEMKV